MVKEKETIPCSVGAKEVTRYDQSPAEMIRLAVEGKADLAGLEKLLELQQQWERNEAKKAYISAMSAFKATPPNIIKDKTVKYKDVKYNHASLYNVTEKISAALSKHGLSAAWSTNQADGTITVTCTITHARGHAESTSLTAGSDTSGSKNPIQAIGSTITYLQRYTLLALTGLATQDQDDDGRESTAEETISEKELHELRDLMIDAKVDETKLCKYLKVESLEAITKSQLSMAKTAIETKKKQDGVRVVKK